MGPPLDRAANPLGLLAGGDMIVSVACGFTTIATVPVRTAILTAARRTTVPVVAAWRIVAVVAGPTR